MAVRLDEWYLDGIAELSYRAFWLVAGIFVALLAPQALAASRQDVAAEADRSIRFDIPAQPLVSALERYSVISGWQVIYDASLATGRLSATVKGDLTPAAALRMLLSNTGLMSQYVATDGVMLVPAPASPGSRQETKVLALYGGYYGRIQAGLRDAFCATPQLRTGAYRIALGLWIGSSGVITRAALLGSTGRPDIDQSIDSAARGISVGEMPPAGFDQPVVVLVTPDLAQQCDAVGNRSQPARTDR